ncbi:hypothetical protein [Chroococcidiopsis sp. CCNUC1]|uniref:hypothetical protein n=1 Tax=Chroococcidiopsis sp. CCNUC1 TaxID=2653189 RepID=UPI00202095AF|nr:hypothetical protein [Chroococcidiopsis sp. CCNUC1]URD50043.1 hypothetical protein M5J74_27550 [Chroococcidiopsis sp. CCNUC1]
MLISIQFPFADARKFLENTGRLDVPGWPLPTPDYEFVRCFGSIRRRRRGGIEGWIGEDEICEADKALRFCNSLKFVDSKLASSILLRCVFRRLYFDGWAVGKYEVGICPKKRMRSTLLNWQFKELIEHFLSLPVSIRNFQGNTEFYDLLRSGKHLVQLYQEATTSQSFLCKPEDWWVRSGVPLLFTQLNAKEDIKLPFWSKPVIISEDEEFQLLHCLVPYSGFNLRMWVLHTNRSSTWRSNHHEKLYESDRARTLRICLLRLHAEHEGLRLILRNIMNEKINILPRTPQSDTLQRYLNSATARISKLETASNKHFETELIEIARESIHIISPGQRDNLLASLERLDIRKNIFDKLERFVNQWANVTLTEVYNMGDTYNIGQAGAAGRYARSDNNTFVQMEQKKTLAEAAAEIQKLLKQLEQSNPTATDADKVAYVNDETTPSFKRRVVSALQAGSEAAIEEFLDNPYINVGKAVVRAWIKLE